MRTAARSGADVHFDWDDQATWEEALRGATGLYLVSPILRIDFAGLVARFLDQAEQVGVRHVTYLSAYGMEQAPADVAPRAVELDLAARSSLISTVIRPAWFVEDFSETFLQPVNDAIVVPAGDGAEAFVSVEDIASVAAVTLAGPEQHAGRAYAPTGPQALTMAEAAQLISRRPGAPSATGTPTAKRGSPPWLPLACQPSTPRSCAHSPLPSPAATALSPTATSSR